MVWVIATLILIVSIIGVVMTLLMLPGMWVVLLTVMLAKLIEPDIMPWWAILVIAVIVLIAELMEFLSSAAGAKVGGATKKGMTAAVIGGIVGAIAGTIFLAFIPIIGSLIGGVVGAGLGTVLIERGGKRTWRESGNAGAGAAVGRFAATFIKTGLAILMGLFATLMAFWPTPAPIEGAFLPESAPPGMIESEEP